MLYIDLIRVFGRKTNMYPISRQAILFVHPVLRVQILEGCHTSVKTDAVDTTVSLVHSSKVFN